MSRLGSREEPRTVNDSRSISRDTESRDWRRRSSVTEVGVSENIAC